MGVSKIIEFSENRLSIVLHNHSRICYMILELKKNKSDKFYPIPDLNAMKCFKILTQFKKSFIKRSEISDSSESVLQVEIHHTQQCVCWVFNLSLSFSLLRVTNHWLINGCKTQGTDRSNDWQIYQDLSEFNKKIFYLFVIFLHKK